MENENKSKGARREATRESIRRLAVCAMLLALYIVVNRFLTIPVGAGIKIGLSFIAPMLAAMLYGPFTGAAVYGLGDFLSAILFPQGIYHPGFTLTAALMGLIWGIFAHPYPFRGRNRVLTPTEPKYRVFAFLLMLIPAALNCLALGLFANSLWLSQLYGSKTYWGWVVARLPQEGLMTAVNCVCGVAFLPVAQLLRKQGFVKQLPIGTKNKQ